MNKTDYLALKNKCRVGDTQSILYLAKSYIKDTKNIVVSDHTIAAIFSIFSDPLQIIFNHFDRRFVVISIIKVSIIKGNEILGEY
jgi:hypothetical protein